MRWFVEVTSLGKPDSESVQVDADTWQKALEIARTERGHGSSMAGFSFELVEDGCRAVDPELRLRYSVRPATPTPREPFLPAPPMAREPAPPMAREAPRPVPPTVESPPPSPPAPAVSAPVEGPPRPSNPPPAPLPPPEVVLSSEPAAPRADVTANVPSQIIFKREQERTSALPVTYREYVYLVPPGITEADAETLLHAQIDLVRTSLARVPPGKLVNLAVFDVAFQGKPPVPPVATLAWKDWRGDPVVGFPRRAQAATGAAPASFPPPITAPSAPPPPMVQAPASVPPPAMTQSPASVPPPAMTHPASVTSPPRPASVPPPAFAPAPASVPPPAQVQAPASVPPPAFAPAPASLPPPAQVQVPASIPPPASPVAAAAERPQTGPSSDQVEPAPALEESALPADARRPPQTPANGEATKTPALEPLAREVMAELPQMHAPRQSRIPGVRVAGEELIADLFEAMHELHFLRDAVEGGEFCLALGMEKIPSRAGIVHLYDIDRREFLVTNTRGAASGLLLHRYPENDPMLSGAMRRRRSIVLTDASQSEARALDRYLAIGGARSLIVAPVMQAGRFLGAIELLNPLDDQPFTESDGNAVSYIAEQFAEFVAARGIVTDPERIAARRN
jgi:hypothetical protein